MTKIKYLCTYWGCENLSAKEFLKYVVDNGYQGVEINFPNEEHFVQEFLLELKSIRENIESEFIFIAQQVLDNKTESVDDYIKRMTSRLEFLVSLKPNAINSHTGKDFFDFSENCKVLNVTEQISKESGIPIWHEIHRGRFSFHLKTLLQYTEVFPNLKLIADFSHFCTVSESLLDDQKHFLNKIYSNSVHIHARVGASQSPQVNNPFAPEWKEHLDRFVGLWQDIVEVQKKKNKE